MIVLSGASASGKTEVAKVLASKYGIIKVITTTTRPIRINETDGVDYFFVTNERFLEMIKEEKFVEYTEYNGNFYGSTKDQIQNNKCIVIDPLGLKAYSKIKDRNVVTFFLESEEDTRYQRMLQRGDSVENASRRIINDRTAFAKSNICKVDYNIDSEHYNVEDVADMIYRLYKDHIK
mgnify:CR=1 FL=1